MDSYGVFKFLLGLELGFILLLVLRLFNEVKK
jgi:hypothetical protein